jgi:hypothetical protein
MARRRSGRRMFKFVGRGITRDVIELDRSRQKLKCSSDVDDVHLRKRRLRARLLFRSLSFVHDVAKRTRMRPIQCLRDRLTKRRAFRVLDEHRRPGERLQCNPVQADRTTKRENRNNAADAVKHVAMLFVHCPYVKPPRSDEPIAVVEKLRFAQRLELIV